MSEPGGRRNVTGLGRAYPDPETGKLYFSVTNFLGVIAKDALVPWAAKMERLACLAASSAAFEEVGVDINCTPAEFSKIVEANLGKQRAHVRELEKAGDIGTETHNRIEWTLRKQMGHIVAAEPPTISEPAMIAFRSWETWASEANFKPLYVEQVVISRVHEYGGAIDYVAEGTLPETGPDPAMFILDWKTGKDVYSEKITGRGNIISADGMLYLYSDNGEVVLAQPTSTGFTRVSSFKVPFGSAQHWAHLVIKDGRMYVRHGNSLMVYSIKK